MGWLFRYPLILGLAMLALAAFIGFGSVRALYWDLTTPDNPELMTLDEAIERSRGKDWIWVELQDTDQLAWDCSSIVFWEMTINSTTGQWMDVVATDPAQSVVIVVNFSDQLNCDELPPVQSVMRGELEHLKGEEYDDSNFEGRLDRYTQAEVYLDLCTNCDPNNRDIAIVAGLGFTLVFLAGGIWSLRKLLR